MLKHFKKNWMLIVAGAALYWLALPPMKCPWAAYLSMACWVPIVANKTAPTKKEYWHLWLIGLLMWLGILQGIRLGNWALYFGWAALSMYVAAYLPLYVFLARFLRHTTKLPLSMACTVAWVVGEWIRAHFATGFTAGILAHSQTPWPWILQIAAHFGSYGVGFFVVLGGTLIYECSVLITSCRIVGAPIAAPNRKQSLRCALLAAIVIGMGLSAASSLNEYDRMILEKGPIKPLARILLIQENIPISFIKVMKNLQDGWLRYEQQTSIAAKKAGPLGVDLVVWPEATFSGGTPWLDWDKSPEVPPDLLGDSEKFKKATQALEQTMSSKLRHLFSLFVTTKPQFILGTDLLKIRSGVTSASNAALWARTENPSDSSYYAKQHLVMFGEYIPIVSRIPFLLKWLNFGKYEAGTEPVTWQLPNGVKISPSICFENFLPHLIQAHVRKLTDKGQSPEILVNITNDAWFKGSSMLDHHVNSAILTAVENRRPMLVAGNQGISAWIDGNGRVVQSLAPLASDSILAEPIGDGRWGLWQVVGDTPAMCLTILCAIALLYNFIRRSKSSARHPNGRDCVQ